MVRVDDPSIYLLVKTYRRLGDQLRIVASSACARRLEMLDLNDRLPLVKELNLDRHPIAGRGASDDPQLHRRSSRAGL